MLQQPEISAGLMGHLARKQTLPCATGTLKPLPYTRPYSPLYSCNARLKPKNSYPIHRLTISLNFDHYDSPLYFKMVSYHVTFLNSASIQVFIPSTPNLKTKFFKALINFPNLDQNSGLTAIIHCSRSD